MTQDPDEIRDDIERTRLHLSRDVDALAYKASPRRMVRDRTNRMRGGFSRMKETVMGTASDMGDRVGSATSDAASSVADYTTEAPAKVKRAAQGNPLAAGVVVFGATWLVSSLLPASRREQQVAAQVESAVKERMPQVSQAAGQAVQEMRDDLREPARQAAESVSSTAREAAQNVKQDAREATQRVTNNP